MHIYFYLFFLIKCFSKTHPVYFNPFWDNQVFVFIAIDEKFFDYNVILNC